MNQDHQNEQSSENSTDAPAQNTENSIQNTEKFSDLPADTDKQTDIAAAETKKKPAALKWILFALIFVILSVIAFGLWKSYQPKEIELQGRVEAETIHIATKVPSRIEEIYVREGQKVHKGQEIVRLFSPEVNAKKQQALAALQSALAMQSTAERGSQAENIATLQANWHAMKAQQDLAQTTYQRGANLYKEGVISRQRRDELHAAALSSASMTEAAYQQYVRAQRGSTPQQKSSADAQVDIANAAVAEANALEAETKLLSPIDGTISKTYGKVSELVAMGVPVASIIVDHDMHVSLNIREDQYAAVYQVQSMKGYIPALNLNADFKIQQISAEGEFATIKTTRQTGGYDIRSFKVELVPARPIADLKAGMSVLFKIQEAK